MIIAVNIVGNLVGGGLGRAHSIAVASIDDATISSWEEFEVRWDLSHDMPADPVVAISEKGDAPAGCGHGSHHARIVRFMKEHQVEAVVTGHIGPPMAHTLDLMGITVVTQATGGARQAAMDAAARLSA
ncbi:MAG: NifB/NifX family molybdenum-iron cluster-binding protein [Propionibacteriaceae bacterium]|nr:NifB/NifX family molybdenum-iron cluster-binding protein [Propionibacteriaceae bacterium]